MKNKSYDKQKLALASNSLITKNHHDKLNDANKKLNKMAFLTQIDSYIADPSLDTVRLEDSCFIYDENDGKCCQYVEQK